VVKNNNDSSTAGIEICSREVSYSFNESSINLIRDLPVNYKIWLLKAGESYPFYRNGLIRRRMFWKVPEIFKKPQKVSEMTRMVRNMSEISGNVQNLIDNFDYIYLLVMQNLAFRQVKYQLLKYNIKTLCAI